MPSTRYAARQPPSEQIEKPVSVLVTGFGPFLRKFPRNSSWEIASTLPALIPASTTNPTPIHIHVHHEAIRVAYETVVNLVPNLLPPKSLLHPTPDIVLHIGLAAGRKFFAIEEGSYGRGYGSIPDVDGQLFPDDLAEEKFPTAIFPQNLTTSFDTSDVLARWKGNLGYTLDEGDLVVGDLPNVQISSDAGNFLCGFIYYNSLAHYYEIKADERPVVFLHVPDLSSSEEKLREGWKVTVALVKALVESRRKVGTVDGVADGENETKERRPEARTDNNFE